MSRRDRSAVFAALAAAMTVLATASGVLAQDAAGPFVRSSLDPGGPVTVGEPVRLVVEEFTPTWFPRAPDFPTLRVENAIVIPAGRTTNINQRIQGQSWAGIRRAYTIYPQVQGDYEVPSPELCTEEDLAPPSATLVRRVRHKKFGEGTVTAADGDKLTIAFDSGTTKVLKESFVSDV